MWGPIATFYSNAVESEPPCPDCHFGVFRDHKAPAMNRQEAVWAEPGGVFIGSQVIPPKSQIALPARLSGEIVLRIFGKVPQTGSFWLLGVKIFGPERFLSHQAENQSPGWRHCTGGVPPPRWTGEGGGDLPPAVSQLIFNSLPACILIAKLCPIGAEGTVFALLAGFSVPAGSGWAEIPCLSGGGGS